MVLFPIPHFLHCRVKGKYHKSETFKHENSLQRTVDGENFAVKIFSRLAKI